MKVNSSHIARSSNASNFVNQKISAQSFGGVLSDVADDATGQAKPTTPVKAQAVKHSDVNTSDAATTNSVISDASTLSLGAPLSTDTAAKQTRDTAEDSAAADGSADTSNADTKRDQTSTVSSDGSLLALVQIAALVPQTNARAADASLAAASAKGTTNSVTASDTDAAVSDRPDPLVSNVTLETHLAIAKTDAAKSDAAQFDVTSTETPADAPSAPGGANAASDAKSDAQAGQSDDGGDSDASSQQATDLADTGTSDLSGTVGSQTDMSGLLQQKATLSSSSLAVADAVTSLATQAAVAAQATTTAAVNAPARTMLLQLSPGDMGTVSVRLHLSGRTLDVSLTASHASTASLLDHDRAALASALGDRDYQLNSLVIQGGDAASTPGGSSASSDSSSNNSSSQSMADQQGGGSDRSGGSSSSSGQNSPARGQAPTASDSARGDALYV